MRVALISTVFNEGATIDQWIGALRKQTARPDEFVIVDGGSKDRTVEALEKGFDGSDFPKPRIIVKRCNIAEGRNLAIQNTTAEVIASIDAGSAPDPRWLEELVRPFREREGVQGVGGWCPMIVTNELQRKVERFANLRVDDVAVGADYYPYPSSRNVAFRRSAWEAVGGYPEWLTLTAEDYLFNENLHFIGVKFYYQPTAIVAWENRPELSSYLKMIRNYGYGCAEVRQAWKKYTRWLVSVLFPPVMLFSRAPLSDLPFRYISNVAGVWGWLRGLAFGRRPPAGWQRINGVWISPQAIAAAKKNLYDAVSARS